MKALTSVLVVGSLSVIAWNTSSFELKGDAIRLYERTTITADADTGITIHVEDADTFELMKMDNAMLCQLKGYETTINEPSYDLDKIQEEIEYRFAHISDASYAQCELMIMQGKLQAIADNAR